MKSKTKTRLLLHAVRNQDYDVAKRLMEKYGADIDAKDDHGDTLLHWACQSFDVHSFAPIPKDLERIRFLVNNGADVNVKDKYGRIPLHRSFHDGFCIDMVALMIDNGVDVNAKDNNGRTLLILACCQDCTDFFDEDEEEVFELVELLIASGADVNTHDNDGKTALHWVCEKAYFEVAGLLIDNGVDHVNAKENERGFTPLHLVSYDAYSGWDGDDYFVGEEKMKLAKLLIGNAGADIHVKNNDGETSLHLACWNGHADVAEVLIKHGATDINIRNKNGETPLHKACWNYHYKIEEARRERVVKLLIGNGADLNAKNNEGKTPLHLTSDWGSLANFCGLLWEGSDGNCQMEIVKLLIENGADLNAQDNDGKTPLYEACKNGWAQSGKDKLDVVKILLSRGSTVNIETAQGSTPLLVASEWDHKEVVWFLVRQYPWLLWNLRNDST